MHIHPKDKILIQDTCIYHDWGWMFSSFIYIQICMHLLETLRRRVNF